MTLLVWPTGECSTALARPRVTCRRSQASTARGCKWDQVRTRAAGGLLWLLVVVHLLWMLTETSALFLRVYVCVCACAQMHLWRWTRTLSERSTWTNQAQLLSNSSSSSSPQRHRNPRLRLHYSSSSSSSSSSSEMHCVHGAVACCTSGRVACTEAAASQTPVQLPAPSSARRRFAGGSGSRSSSSSSAWTMGQGMAGQLGVCSAM